MAKKPSPQKTVETLKHDMDKRKNIPTAEFQASHAIHRANRKGGPEIWDLPHDREPTTVRNR
jgi:hypothetical protein